MKVRCECGREVPEQIVEAIRANGGSGRCTSCGCLVDQQFVWTAPLIDPAEIHVKSLKALGGNGILNSADLHDLNEGARQVGGLLSDGRWHSAEEIRWAAGDGKRAASEGLRRARELREVPGLRLERRRIADTRSFVYRLVRKT